MNGLKSPESYQKIPKIGLKVQRVASRKEKVLTKKRERESQSLKILFEIRACFMGDGLGLLGSLGVDLDLDRLVCVPAAATEVDDVRSRLEVALKTESCSVRNIYRK